MKNILQKALNILKNNLIFIQPLLLYMLILMSLFGNLLTARNGIYLKILIIFTLFLLTVVFFAGWFHINKLAVINYNETDSEEAIYNKTLNNLKTFFQGTGENFFKVFTGLILYLTFYFILTLLIFKGYLIISKTSNIIEELTFLIRNPDITAYKSLLKNHIYFILLIGLFSLVMDFFGVLYAAVMFKGGKNPFTALFSAIKFFFLNIFKSAYLIGILFIINMFISIINTFSGNSFFFIISTILLAIYFNYYVILVFCFYNEKNNSDNRAEFIG